MNAKQIILDTLTSATGPMKLGEIFQQNPSVSEDELRGAAWELVANHEVTIDTNWKLLPFNARTLLQELEEARAKGFAQRQQLDAENAETNRQAGLEQAREIVAKLPGLMKNRAEYVGKNGGKLEVEVLYHLESKHPAAVEMVEAWLAEQGICSERRRDFNPEDGAWHDLIALW